MTSPAAATSPDAPVLDVDPFSYETLSHPYDFDKLVRDTGDIVWLSAYGIWATGKYEFVDAIFRDYETFESSSGTGLTNIKKETGWRKPSLILETDPPEHDKYRRIMANTLSPTVAKKLQHSFQATADELVARVLADAALNGGEIDAAVDVAEAYPLAVLPDAIGFQKTGREHLLPYSNLNFQAMGPQNEFYLKALEGAEEAKEYVTWQMRREALTKGGLGDQIYDAALDSGVSEEDAGLLVRTFLSAGVDTTIYAIQFALKALAENPQAWAALKADPKIARTVFEETLRCYATSPYIMRTTTRPVDIGGVHMEAEQKVLLLLAAANHDTDRWDNPDVFDIERDTRGHLTFGTGVHGCVGQMMARLEGTCLLTAIAKQVETLEVTGTPELKYSNWLRGFEHLPMRLIPSEGRS